VETISAFGLIPWDEALPAARSVRF